MRFASIQGSNAGDYASAGKAVSGAASNIFATARKYGPDYSGLGEVAIKTRSDEKQAAIAAETAVAKAGLTAVGNIKSTQLTTDASVKRAEINADAKLHVFDQGLKTKMAGKLAAVGTASAAALSSGKSKRPRAPSIVDYSGEISVLEAKTAELRAQAEKVKSETVASSKTKPTQTSTNTKQSEVVSNGKGPSLSLRAGDEGAALNILGKYESDGVGGYNAINQIGIKGGHGTMGYSGDITNMPQHGGRPLTDFTVGEIMDNQSNNNMTDQQWIDAGRFHAVGRYQFIGDTLRSEVARQGISRDSKFTPELQDQLALSYLRAAGSVNPWVGPRTHGSADEIALVNRVANSTPMPVQKTELTQIAHEPRNREGDSHGSF